MSPAKGRHFANEASGRHGRTRRRGIRILVFLTIALIALFFAYTATRNRTLENLISDEDLRGLEQKIESDTLDDLSEIYPNMDASFTVKASIDGNQLNISETFNAPFSPGFGYPLRAYMLGEEFSDSNVTVLKELEDESGIDDVTVKRTAQFPMDDTEFVVLFSRDGAVSHSMPNLPAISLEDLSNETAFGIGASFQDSIAEFESTVDNTAEEGIRRAEIHGNEITYFYRLGSSDYVFNLEEIQNKMHDDGNMNQIKNEIIQMEDSLLIYGITGITKRFYFIDTDDNVLYTCMFSHDGLIEG